MNPILKNAFVAAGLTAATQAAADITLYEHPGFRGQSVTEQRQIRNLERSEFNNSASSAVVRGEAWQLCDEPAFSGRCVVLPPGEYPSLGQMGLNDSVSSARMEARVEPPIAPGPAKVTLFGRENFQGRPFTVDRPIGDLERFDFSDRASSVIIQGGTWEVCDDVRFSGRCVTLQPGRYPSLAAIGLGDRISSLRLAASVPPPAPMPGQITFYGRQNFEGRAITVDRPVSDLERLGFGERASSVVVSGAPWEVCDDIRYGGRCVVLRPGQYPSLAALGLNNRISSVRAAGSPG